MPRAWLVPEVVRGNREEVLHAIKNSQLPDGRSYNPSQVALVEEKLDFKADNVDSSATAKIVNLSDTQVVVQTSSLSPSFLVLSDIYYPGWKVSIDRKPSHIYKTNFVLRGVQVPVGTHTLKFEFKPMSFHIGAGISTASLVLLGYLYFKFQPKQKLLLNE
nr:YfhO family protein [Trichocoleus sp. FACHB-40]